ncbi:MAG TPA: hypothetical protein VMN36_13310, partial [Verrucomicrobiales bacterium]|nr:hypothetical protein [Verrucomicrobiales bacterium]
GLYLFNTGSQTFLAHQTVPNLSLAGGTLAGDAALTITGSASWTGGLMTETGRTVVAEDATLTISGNFGKGMDAGRVLENRGTVLWSGGGINLNNTNQGGSGKIENALTGVFVMQIESGSISASGFGDLNTPPLPSFDNAGTLRKTGGTSESIVAVPFTNTGTVEVETGTLRLTGGGSNAGRVSVAAEAALAPQTLDFLEGSQLEGEGLYLFNTGSQTFLAHQTVPNLSLAGGTLAGDAALTITGSASWTGGLMTGTGRTVVAEDATLTISGGFGKGMDAGRVLENRGTVLWSGGGIDLNNTNQGGSGRIENAPTGVFVMQIEGGSISASRFGDVETPPLPSFDNAGTLRKTGNGSSTTLSVPFTNTGTVEMLGGTLNATGSVTLTAESAFRFVIGGPSPGADFGRFTATGTLDLNGTIDFALANEFAPAEGQRFTVMAAGMLAGEFADVLGNVLPNRLFFSPDQRLRELVILTKSGLPALETGAWPAGSQFRIRGIPGQLYRVYASPGLGAGGWALLDTFIMPAHSYTDFIDPEAASFRQRFYIAEFVPADP